MFRFLFSSFKKRFFRRWIKKCWRVSEKERKQEYSRGSFFWGFFGTQFVIIYCCFNLIVWNFREKKAFKFQKTFSNCHFDFLTGYIDSQECFEKRELIWWKVFLFHEQRIKERTRNSTFFTCTKQTRYNLTRTALNKSLFFGVRWFGMNIRVKEERGERTASRKAFANILGSLHLTPKYFLSQLASNL